MTANKNLKTSLYEAKSCLVYIINKQCCTHAFCLYVITATHARKNLRSCYKVVASTMLKQSLLSFLGRILGQHSTDNIVLHCFNNIVEHRCEAEQGWTFVLIKQTMFPVVNLDYLFQLVNKYYSNDD